MVYRNAVVMDGQPWNKAYGISDAAAADLESVLRYGADGKEKIIADYVGTSITTSDYNGFPIGSKIFDYSSSTKKIYVKSAATTWVAVTIS